MSSPFLQRVMRGAVGYYLALGAGIAITLPFVSKKGQDEPSRDSSGGTALRDRTHAATRSGGSGSRSQEYQAAWDLLKTRIMSTEEKAELRKKLLLEWQEIDLDAALAALDNPGDYECFRDKMSEHPELFEAAIRVERDSMTARQHPLEWLWLSTQTRKNPSMVVSRISEISLRLLETTCRWIAVSAEGTKMLEEKLAALPDTPENRLIWAQTRGPFRDKANATAKNQEEILSALQAATTPWDRCLLLDQISNVFAGSKGSPTDYLKRLDQIPEDLRTDAAMTIIRRGSFDSNPSTLPMVDYLIAKGDWAALAGTPLKEDFFESDGFNNSNSAARQKKLFDWAATLPERAEVSDLYQNAIGSYLKGNPKEAEAWLDSLPDGWRRDQAQAKWSEIQAEK